MIHVSYAWNDRYGRWGFVEMMAKVDPPQDEEALRKLRDLAKVQADRENPDTKIAKVVVLAWNRMD